MTNKQPAPFSKDYVIGVTKRHMVKSIEMSIAKTLERMSEFNAANNAEKSLEAFETLTVLQGMKNSFINK